MTDIQVQVKGDKPERVFLDATAQYRRECATALYMEQISDIARSGYPDDQKICYVRIILNNWRSRMAQIDAGLY